MTTPADDVDLFHDDVLTDPYPHLARLRSLGPAVWIPSLEAHAVTRYADVRAVLADSATFCSGAGVGFNDEVNTLGAGSTLMSDGDEHDVMRAAVGDAIRPKALNEMHGDVTSIAERLVDDLLDLGEFDAVPELAAVLPATWVPELIGVPPAAHGRLIGWADATFNFKGPPNSRCTAAADDVQAMVRYSKVMMESTLPGGSLAANVVRLKDEGRISERQCRLAIMDYLSPSIDTTISAIGNTIWAFASHHDQWELLVGEPERVPQAFNEALRFESPVSAFSRVTTRPVAIDGVDIEQNSRLYVSFASANRDERHWDRPDQFDITRRSAGQMAFGHGEHACVGMGLARMEAHAVLTALARRVARIELVGEPTRRLNNTIRGFESLPVRLHRK